MKDTSKELLHLEYKDPSATPLESRLLVCNASSQSSNHHPNKMPRISPVSPSSVLGKIKGFLGDMSKANEHLLCNAKENPQNYDIEMLTGNESEVIEMNLILGVADLHTPEAEAEAAVKLSIPHLQAHIPLEDDSSDTESYESDNVNDDSRVVECSDGDSEVDDSSGDEYSSNSEIDGRRAGSVSESKLDKNNSSEDRESGRSEKRPKIVELS